jgi:DNA-directed RNA polymerase subunit RPC12/RpoP
MRCTNCGSEQHPTSHCPDTWSGSSARLHLRCTYCGGRDHNYEACPKIRSHPAPGGVALKDKRR